MLIFTSKAGGRVAVNLKSVELVAIDEEGSFFHSAKVEPQIV